MPILCEPASSAGELLSGIDGEVRKADTLAAAAKLLDGDPHEILVIIGPRAVTGDALAFAASLRLARPAVGVILARREVDVTLLIARAAVRRARRRSGRGRRGDGRCLPPVL